MKNRPRRKPSAEIRGHTPLLCRKEAADFLNVSDAYLERAAVFGYGPPFIKLGPGKFAGVRYRLPDLIQWTDANRHGGGAV
jgi:hypothetical protein